MVGPISYCIWNSLEVYTQESSGAGIPGVPGDFAEGALLWQHKQTRTYVACRPTAGLLKLYHATVIFKFPCKNRFLNFVYFLIIPIISLLCYAIKEILFVIQFYNSSIHFYILFVIDTSFMSFRRCSEERQECKTRENRWICQRHNETSPLPRSPKVWRCKPVQGKSGRSYLWLNMKRNWLKKYIMNKTDRIFIAWKFSYGS